MVSITTNSMVDLGGNVFEVDLGRVYDDFDLILKSYTKGTETGISISVEKIFNSGLVAQSAFIAVDNSVWSVDFTTSQTNALVWNFGSLYNVDKVKIYIATDTPGLTDGTAEVEVIKNKHN